MSASSIRHQDEICRQVEKLVNRTRIAHGMRPLKRAAGLRKAAMYHAVDMSRNHYFSHDSRDGTVWYDRINRYYKNEAGENIAYGQKSAKEVFNAWMNSPGHRRNILDRNFRTFGTWHSPPGNYWVQDFGY